MTFVKTLMTMLAMAAVPYAVQAQSVTAQPSPIMTITLAEAIQRAETSDTTYASAVADHKVAQAQTGIARSALLPGVVYHNEYLYTQPQHLNGKPVTDAPRFIANNGIHEYMSQASVTETISGAGVTDWRKSAADAAAARANLEVARRGLISSVVTSYYEVLAADEKLTVMQRALDEATHFGQTSEQLEKGGEVAHADTLKANLQMQQRQRDYSDAQLAAEKASLDLAVLLFADPLTPYGVTGDLQTLPELPLRSQIDASAKTNNPDMKAALAEFHAAKLEVTSSWLDYLPSLSLNYTYGVDAAQFATHSPDGMRNLGYSAYATLDIPIWDWFATQDRVKQSEARRDLAQVQLTSTQRRLVASLEELYSEAEVAKAQLATLDQSVGDAREALRLTNLRYSAGDAPVLEVVDAQNTLIQTETSRADGAVRYYTALANLQTLTGNMP